MSRVRVTNMNYQKTSKKDEINLNLSKKVDINVLLNKVRTQEKKEIYSGSVFFGLIVVAIVATGFFVSL